MPTTDTPLRYPGGKSQLTPLVVEILRRNSLFYGEYAEPFAGGAGIAMTLLLNGYVDQIHLNDFDESIYAFWYAVLNQSEELCSLIETIKVDMDEWHRQRKIHRASGHSLLTRGFSTLFLNRTNRSGILKAGVIGGLKQEGNYKLDCRFNRGDLIRKIKRIAANRARICLSRLDAVEFIHTILPKTGQNTFVNLDPPYFSKGQELYANAYQEADHAALAGAVHSIGRRWMVTYDDTPEIRKLYASYPLYSSRLNYSAQVKRVGCELLILDPRLKPPPQIAHLNLPVNDSLVA
jgi:DNA adenine methylase